DEVDVLPLAEPATAHDRDELGRPEPRAELRVVEADLFSQLAPERLPLLLAGLDPAAGRDPERRAEPALPPKQQQAVALVDDEAADGAALRRLLSEPFLQRPEPAQPLRVRHRGVRRRGRREHEQAGVDERAFLAPSSARSRKAPRYASLPTNAIARGAWSRAIR